MQNLLGKWGIGKGTATRHQQNQPGSKQATETKAVATETEAQ